MLQRGETVARRLTVAEGLTVAQIFALLDEAAGLSGPLPELPPEGSLLPETYFYAYGDSRINMVKRMREAMRETLADLWTARAENLPFAGPEEALILASIVDKETPPAPRDAAPVRPDRDLRPDGGRRCAWPGPHPAGLAPCEPVQHLSGGRPAAGADRQSRSGGHRGGPQSG
jgi:hypothetical protein